MQSLGYVKVGSPEGGRQVFFCQGVAHHLGAVARRGNKSDLISDSREENGNVGIPHRIRDDCRKIRRRFRRFGQYAGRLHAQSRSRLAHFVNKSWRIVRIRARFADDQNGVALLAARAFAEEVSRAFLKIEFAHSAAGI